MIPLTDAFITGNWNVLSNFQTQRMVGFAIKFKVTYTPGQLNDWNICKETDMYVYKIKDFTNHDSPAATIPVIAYFINTQQLMLRILVKPSIHRICVFLLHTGWAAATLLGQDFYVLSKQKGQNEVKHHDHITPFDWYMHTHLIWKVDNELSVVQSSGDTKLAISGGT